MVLKPLPKDWKEGDPRPTTAALLGCTTEWTSHKGFPRKAPQSKHWWVPDVVLADINISEMGYTLPDPKVLVEVVKEFLNPSEPEPQPVEEGEIER
jgi:hypothetical protein